MANMWMNDKVNLLIRGRFTRLGQTGISRAFQNFAVCRKPASMAGTIPTVFGVVPVYDTTHMGAYTRNYMQFSLIVTEGSQMLVIQFYGFTFSRFNFL